MDYFIENICLDSNNKKTLINTDGEQLIYCFDISSSMGYKYPIDANEQLMRTMKIQANNHKSITRFECLKQAIKGNIDSLLKNAPNTKVGFTTFGSEVISYGDCCNKKVILTNLKDEQEIIKQGVTNQMNIDTPIEKSYKEIKKQLDECQLHLHTALGPAMLLSIALIQKTVAGSRIILCTDGCANTGLGSFISKDNNSKPADFYTHLGNLAKEKGIVISLITFNNANSCINVLMGMVEITGGEILCVNPSQIVEEFNNVLDNIIIARDVSIQIKLHEAMCFKNEKKEHLKDEDTLLYKTIGNVTKQSELYAEYSFKKSKQIADLLHINITTLKEIPFQIIIHYTTKEGERCIRVNTKSQKISTEKKRVHKQSNFDIISTNAIQKSATIARTGDYRSAQANAYGWKKFIKANLPNEKAKFCYDVFSENLRDFHHDVNEMISAPKKAHKIQTNDQMIQRLYTMNHSDRQTSIKYYEYSKLSNDNILSDKIYKKYHEKDEKIIIPDSQKDQIKPISMRNPAKQNQNEMFKKTENPTNSGGIIATLKKKNSFTMQSLYKQKK